MARVLIVDDEPSIRTTLAEFIRDDGHEVFTAEDAGEAVKMIEQETLDVVVTDIILPRMTGVALLAHIHDRMPDTQVIMITGEPTVETASAAVRDGAFDYLSKPITRDAIRSAVASAARVKQLYDERRRLEAENERYREHLEEEVSRKTDEVRSSEAKYRAVFENAVETILVVVDGRVRLANPSAARLIGYDLEELASADSPFIEYVHPDDSEWIIGQHARRVRGESAPGVTTFRIVRGDGAVRWVELRAVLISWDGEPATLNFINDITERKAAEDAQHERQERIRRTSEALMRLATDRAVYEGNLEPTIHLITETAAEALEVARVAVWLHDEADGMLRCVDTYVRSENRHTKGRDYPTSDLPIYLAALEKSRVLNVADVRNDPRMIEFDLEAIAAEGTVSVLDASVRSRGRPVGDICFMHAGGQRRWSHEAEEFASEVASLVALTLESSQRRRAEEALERSESEYRALFEDSPAALWHEDFSRVKVAIDRMKAEGVTDFASHLARNPRLVDELVAMVRVVDVNEAACAMHGASTKEEMFAGAEAIVGEATRGSLRRQLVAIAAGATLFDDITIDQTLQSEPIDVSLRWSVPPGHEESLDRVLVAKIDVTRALEAERKLRTALDGTIEAIGLTTETRDPYTAGHQRHVTELAIAIAEEMGCDSDVVDGVRAAGLMHDIGKMAIPAEILSKPNLLTETERALIETHPRVAYDILKKVVFPWPVAEIVLQHHERLDGSGYPRGLEGDEISLEARILSVSDVVEAIASHRPYRPALGNDVALDEIKKRRGTFYDEAVVDACLRLFRNKGFAFSQDQGAVRLHHAATVSLSSAKVNRASKRSSDNAVGSQ